MNIQIGYAQATITPSLSRPVYLAGFGHNRRAESIHDELYVRALALEENGRFLIILACDLISLHRGQCQYVQQQVQAQLPQARLLIACTHTHHGPDTLGLWGPDEKTSGVDDEYLKEILAQMTETAVSATTHLQPAHLAATAIEVPGVARNFRDPHITDEELTCLQFRTVEGERPLATWLIFPCHPEVLWDKNPHITSDYIFSLRQQIETETDAPCLVHVGALGGMMSPNVIHHSFAEATEMGQRLAQAAQTALNQVFAHPMSQFAYHQQEFDVPLENPLFEMAAAIGLLPDVKRADGTVRTEASLLRLQDAWLFAVPGELLPKLGLHYRQLLKEHGARITAVIGLANDELGYILPAEDFTPPTNYLEPGDHYEESMSLGRQTGTHLTTTLHTLLNQ